MLPLTNITVYSDKSAEPSLGSYPVLLTPRENFQGSLCLTQENPTIRQDNGSQKVNFSKVLKKIGNNENFSFVYCTAFYFLKSISNKYVSLVSLLFRLLGHRPHFHPPPPPPGIRIAPCQSPDDGVSTSMECFSFFAVFDYRHIDVD